MNDLVAGSLGSHQLLSSLDVIDDHIVVVVHVDASHVSLARTDGDGSHSSGAFLQLECCFLLGGICVPDMHGGRLSHLACDYGLAVCTHVESQDVILMVL